MARPKKEPFFEVDLPHVLPETEKWLYTFHCNSKMVVEYMLGRTLGVRHEEQGIKRRKAK